MRVRALRAGLRDAVARGAATHVLQGSESRRDVDDPPVTVAPHEGDGYLAQAPGPEQFASRLSFTRSRSASTPRWPSSLRNTCIVHQNVQPSELLLDRAREQLDAWVCHVKLPDDHAVRSPAAAALPCSSSREPMTTV